MQCSSGKPWVLAFMYVDGTWHAPLIQIPLQTVHLLMQQHFLMPVVAPSRLLGWQFILQHLQDLKVSPWPSNSPDHHQNYHLWDVWSMKALPCISLHSDLLSYGQRGCPVVSVTRAGDFGSPVTYKVGTWSSLSRSLGHSTAAVTVPAGLGWLVHVKSDPDECQDPRFPRGALYCNKRSMLFCPHVAGWYSCQQYSITSERALASWSRANVYDLQVTEDSSVCNIHWLTGEEVSSFKLQTKKSHITDISC